MIEYALALLPVAAGSGWYLASRHYQSKVLSANLDHSGYFKGLNYLLNEQPDKAIDVFINLLDVDNETIETHLALGALFRQRGEVEKSIRLHQNLIARPQLTERLRSDVLNELGLDYMRAGLLDRAENIYLDLIQVNPESVEALQQLLSIYQQEREWSDAIEYALRLEKLDGRELPVLLSHLYCELAVSYLVKQDVAAAKSSLKEAYKKDNSAVRVIVMQAEMAADEGNYKQALNYYLSLDKVAKVYVPVFLEQILGCFNMLNRQKEKMKFLSLIADEIDSATLVDKIVADIKDQQGAEAALRFVKDKLTQSADFTYLMLYAKLVVETAQEREDSDFLLEVINQLYRIQLVFQCGQCGFDSTELNWLCPSCKTWGSCLPTNS